MPIKKVWKDNGRKLGIELDEQIRAEVEEIKAKSTNTNGDVVKLLALIIEMLEEREE